MLANFGHSFNTLLWYNIAWANTYCPKPEGLALLKKKRWEMILRGINFGYVINAAGARNFDGNGYWHHRLLKPLGLDWTGSTFHSSTTPFNANPGNMRLIPGTLTPWELFPRCIKINWITGDVVNAKSLSSPGLKVLLEMGIWQKQTSPFFIDFMSIAETEQQRLEELEQAVELILLHQSEFQAPFGLVHNESCVNVGLDETELIGSAHEKFRIGAKLNVPQLSKLSVRVTPKSASHIAASPHCDGLIVTNTILYESIPVEVRRKMFGERSPLRHLGGGGYSGPYLRDLVIAWVTEAKQLNIHAKILAGGGILTTQDAAKLFDVGPDAIFLGSVSITRFWRLQEIIQLINLRYRLKEASALP